VKILERRNDGMTNGEIEWIHALMDGWMPYDSTSFDLIGSVYALATLRQGRAFP